MYYVRYFDTYGNLSHGTKYDDFTKAYNAVFNWLRVDGRRAEIYKGDNI